MESLTVTLPKIKTVTATVVDVKTFFEDSFLLALKLDKKMNFKAGQFVMVYYKDKKRPFSISSPPSQETIELLVRKHENGAVTPYLAKLKRGDKVKISGPYGAFCVKETSAKEIVFIAAGCGIAPFRGMIQDLLEKGIKKRITLIFGFRYDFYFEDIFRELEKRYRNFKLYATCSKPTEEWKGLRGHVTEYFKEILRNAEDKEVYTCGPEEMIEASKTELLKMGFKLNQMHVERWGAVLSGK